MDARPLGSVERVAYGYEFRHTIRDRFRVGWIDGVRPRMELRAVVLDGPCRAHHAAPPSEGARGNERARGSLHGHHVTCGEAANARAASMERERASRSDP